MKDKRMKRPTKFLDCNIEWELSKIKSADGNVVIEGWANTADKDRVGDIMVPEAFSKSLEEYMGNPVLLYQHDWDKVIGRVEESKIVPQKGLWVKAIISNAKDVDDVRTKILEGALKTFSIGYNEVDAVYDEGRKANFVKEVELLEISVVTIPANSGAKFTVAQTTKVEPSSDQKDITSDLSEGFCGYLAHVMKELPDDEEILPEFIIQLKGIYDKFNENPPMNVKVCGRRGDESLSECVSRAIPELINDGKDQDQAIAIAYSVCEKRAAPAETKSLRSDIIQLFRENPNPQDEVVHQFAADHGLQPDEVEAEIYAILSEAIAKDPNKVPAAVKVEDVEGEDGKGGAGSGGSRSGAGRPRGDGGSKPSAGRVPLNAIDKLDHRGINMSMIMDDLDEQSGSENPDQQTMKASANDMMKEANAVINISSKLIGEVPGLGAPIRAMQSHVDKMQKAIAKGDWEEYHPIAINIVDTAGSISDKVNKGKSTEPTDTKSPEDQLPMGLEVEMEHSDSLRSILESAGVDAQQIDMVLANAIEAIAKDHIAEIPDYYTRLTEMEGSGKGGAGSGGSRSGAGRPRGDGGSKPGSGKPTAEKPKPISKPKARAAVAEAIGLTGPQLDRIVQAGKDKIRELKVEARTAIDDEPASQFGDRRTPKELIEDSIEQIEFKLDTINHDIETYAENPTQADLEETVDRINGYIAALKDEGVKWKKENGEIEDKEEGKSLPKPDHEKSLKEHELDHHQRTMESAWKSASVAMKELASAHNQSAREQKCSKEHSESRKAYDRSMGEVEKCAKSLEDAKSMAEAEQAEATSTNQGEKQ